jgi:hypothetical protein
VVYKKLMDCTPTLEDLEDCNPQLARGLKMLLEFDGDVEEVIYILIHIVYIHIHIYTYIYIYRYIER